MAFCNKIGNLLRRGAAQSSPAPVSSMLNYIRCMSSSKLFIGGLSYEVDGQSLMDAFAGFGDVVEATVIINRYTGCSRGFGYVNFTSEESASSALSAMNGQELAGRHIRVSYASDRPCAGGYAGGYGYARMEGVGVVIGDSIFYFQRTLCCLCSEFLWVCLNYV